MTQSTETKKDITTTIDAATMTMVITFSDGHVIRLNAEELSHTIQRQATMHGLKQKCIDAAAIARDTVTGKPATIRDKYLAVNEVYERLMGGEWNKRRESGEGDRGGLLFRALVRLYPAKTHESLREFLAKKSKSEQAALRTNPKIAAIIDEIRAEGVGEIDSDELLNELEG